jgi:hypothetical protein
MRIRRAATLFLILALVVGAAPMPRASAAPDLDLAGPVTAGDCCRPCAPADAAGAECGAVCQSPAAIVHAVAASVHSAAPSPWSWSNESVRRRAIAPATAPPQS